MAKPITLLLTEGDPAGIGPEVAALALAEWSHPDDCRAIVVGYPKHFAARGDRAAALEFKSAETLAAFPDRPGVAAWSPGAPELNAEVPLGWPSAAGARAAVACIEAAAREALAGRADAIVTAPISKEGLALIGSPYPGHTEMLAALAGGCEVAMLLAARNLRVALATIHVPLARVPKLLSVPRLLASLKLLHAALPDFGFAAPRIGVTGINPHAGEAGRFGREEIEIIAPAVAAARAAGIDARGPFPADTIFFRALEGEFDAVLAMTHDQGLIPVKTLDFHGAVNVTLGLPFVRTSPDHGTAYDLAGRGSARADSFLAALDLAYRLARGRRAAAGAAP